MGTIANGLERAGGHSGLAREVAQVYEHDDAAGSIEQAIVGMWDPDQGQDQISLANFTLRRSLAARHQPFAQRFLGGCAARVAD